MSLTIPADTTVVAATGTGYQGVTTDDRTKASVATWKIPLLWQIPIIGPALFEQNVIVYITIVLVVAVHIGLFYTRWGLRTRSVGEHPTAAGSARAGV